jgi:hypothetical protein
MCCSVKSSASMLLVEIAMGEAVEIQPFAPYHP